jgi:tetratricopeptide (TPR) repeat protein
MVSDPKKTPLRSLWWLLPALALVTLAVYQPAWHGGILWDDDGHLTKPELQGADGLRRIWAEIGVTQQYYPIVHSTFWVFNRLWGWNTLPYHLLNIVLHALSAFLFALILRRLSVTTGVAILSAVIFAVHPVHAESVAWMTELKNTMSSVWYLAAAFVYLRFDRERRSRDYAIALLFFILAMLSKTVAASLPAALLVVCWWQRGKLDWRRDVQPLIPFVLIGLAGGLTTAWVERTYIGAQGFEYELTAIERALIAGRAVWFYLASLVWPANLIFVYPKWHVSQSVWWQYLFPAAAIAAVAVLWSYRYRSRAALAAALFFIGTLFPALGFVNIFPFRYSYVADHFQYLASLGIIAIVAAAMMALAMRRLAESTATMTLVAIVGVPFGALTWQYSRQYVDIETLYRTTIARNPGCWMAYNNLGAIKLRGTPDEAREGYELIEKSVAINPDNAEARDNLGYALQQQGKLAEALAQHDAAIRLLPTFGDAHNNRGAALQKLGRLPDAEQAFREAVRLQPASTTAHENLGAVLQRMGRWSEAADAYRLALRTAPASERTANGLGYVLLRLGRAEEARQHLEVARRLAPTDASVHFNLGNALLDLGRAADAVAEFREALKYEPPPGAAETHNNLGIALAQLGRLREAAEAFTEAVRIDPNYSEAKANLVRARGK